MQPLPHRLAVAARGVLHRLLLRADRLVPLPRCGRRLARRCPRPPPRWSPSRVQALRAASTACFGSRRCSRGQVARRFARLFRRARIVRRTSEDCDGLLVVFARDVDLGAEQGHVGVVSTSPSVVRSASSLQPHFPWRGGEEPARLRRAGSGEGRVERSRRRRRSRRGHRRVRFSEGGGGRCPPG